MHAPSLVPCRYRYRGIFTMSPQSIYLQYDWLRYFTPGHGVGVDMKPVGSIGHPYCGVCCCCRVQEREVGPVALP
jgi:hypothetical protein